MRCMVKNIIVVGTDSFLYVIKQMYLRGEVSKEQYEDCLYRHNNVVPKQWRETKTIKL
jgi:hypothetical protein